MSTVDSRLNVDRSLFRGRWTRVHRVYLGLFLTLSEVTEKRKSYDTVYIPTRPFEGVLR